MSKYHVSKYHEIQDARLVANREFDRQLAEIQEACPHTELTPWLMGYHEDVRLCCECMKAVERKPRNRP